MKFAIFLCLLLVGAALSHKCTLKAKKMCLKGPDTVLKTRLHTCMRLKNYRNCMKGKDNECFEYFNKVWETECVEAPYS